MSTNLPGKGYRRTVAGTAKRGWCWWASVTLIAASREVTVARSSVLGSAARVAAASEDREAVNRLREAVAGATTLVIRLSSGEEIPLPIALIKILQVSAEELWAGHEVTVLAAESTLTPAEVGELLGLSRPFVARLLDQGQIPYDTLPDSNHRVVKLTDVLAFQARRERRREGVRRIGEVIQSDDLPY
jgi:excisionase family DNA binding protein